MFSRELDKLKRSVITTSIALMFTGILLILIPPQYIPVLNIAAGFGLLVVSVVTIFIFLGSTKSLLRFFQLFIGLSAGMVGISLWIFGDMFIKLLILVIGGFPIISGIPTIFHAFSYTRRSGRKGWWILVLSPVILMILAGFLLFNPWLKSDHAIMHTAGAMLISCSIINGLRLIALRPMSRE